MCHVALKSFTKLSQEKVEGRIELEEDCELLEKMIDFCFTETYETFDPVISKTLLYHAQLYVLGDKYGISRLRKSAIAALSQALDDDFLYRAVPKPAMMNDLLATIAYLYENTRDNDVIRKMMAYFPWSSTKIESCPDEFAELLRCYPDYALNVILYSGDKIVAYDDFCSDLTVYTCASCGSSFLMSKMAALDEMFACYKCRKRDTSLRFSPSDCDNKPPSREVDMDMTTIQ